MTTVEAPVTYTPAEIARLSDETGKLYELHDGRLVEKGADASPDGISCMSMRSNSAAVEIAFRLRSVYHLSKAYVFIEQPTYCFDDPDRMRRPELALVWAERLPGGLNDSELTIPPNLVVEVVSPTNTYNGLLERVEEYLAAGVPIAWLVAPAQRHLYVHRRDGSLTRYRHGDVLKDEPLLPGLTMNIADIFPAPSLAPGQ